MTEEPSLRELPGALRDYAAGVADVVARGLVVIAVPVILLALLALFVVGGGISLVVLAVVGPAVAAAVWLEVPSRIRAQLEQR
ncbi:hypothetical protein [Halobellus rufus]|uniref:hypothetical protein n=1 Tax=Halobellus rufus TaxID=1448860 RepID=UPI0006798DD5|nr:hypothetical protein [Halobellus rufus]